MPNTVSGKIYITQDLEAKVKEFLSSSRYSHVAIIVDENTEEHCLPLIKSILPDASLIKITSGEENKTLATCASIWQQMTDLEMDRKGLVVDLGGGVIGDMGGFCASTYKRGIDFIQIPTTLLSQVDASVGGKLGVDFNAFKNHIGVFCEPRAVFIHTPFIKTLDPREVRSGFAEIIKHCLIWDKNKWNELILKPFEEHEWDDLVAHSISVKAKVVTEDPKEQGLRKILNFGHTVGHAIESFYLNTDKRLLHGEAIAIGMVCEAWLSFKRKYIDNTQVEVIKRYIIQTYGHVKIDTNDLDEIIPLTIQDKKNEGGVVNASLLKAIGQANYNQPINAQDIKESIDYYNLVL